LFRLFESELSDGESQVAFYTLNYETTKFRKHYLEEMNMPMVRMNFAPHAYLKPDAIAGEVHEFDCRAAIYTYDPTTKKTLDPNLVGIESCSN